MFFISDNKLEESVGCFLSSIFFFQEGSPLENGQFFLLWCCIWEWWVCVYCGLVSSLRGRRHLCAFFPQAEPGGSTHPEAARTALQPWGCFHFCTWKLSREAEAVASETASAFAKASNCQYQEKWIWTKAGFVRSCVAAPFSGCLFTFFFCNRKIEDPFRVLLHYWWCAAFKRNCFCKNDGLLLLCLLFFCFFFWKMTASLIYCMH